MKRNDLGLKIPARRGDCQEFCARKLDRSAGRGPDHDGMTSARIVALTLDHANAQYRKKQCVDQRHRQDQREGEISRFAQRFRHLRIRDEQALPRTSPSARYDSISIHRLAGYNPALADWSGALSTENN